MKKLTEFSRIMMEYSETFGKELEIYIYIYISKSERQKIQ